MRVFVHFVCGSVVCVSSTYLCVCLFKCLCILFVVRDFLIGTWEEDLLRYIEMDWSVRLAHLWALLRLILMVSVVHVFSASL